MWIEEKAVVFIGTMRTQTIGIIVKIVTKLQNKNMHR